MTAHYNILYNGLESFRQGEKSLIDNYRDNYTDILPLFPYSGAEKAGGVRDEMDRAINKGQKLIKEKSIKVKPKRKPSRHQERYAAFYNRREFNSWVDEAYMLIGKAHLYNHDFNEALVYFDYTIREFSNHPVRFEALIWMARTRIEMGDYDNALLLLNQYDGMGKAPNRLYGEFMATYADYLIHLRQYEAAIPFMVAATDQVQGKWNKSRRNYILAQLYQQSGQYQMARESFLKVSRSNPEYEMNLNSRLNLAILNGQLDGNTQAARKELNKLVKQSKNQEYRDRIYYILAKSYLNEGDTLNTITNLRLSAGYNTENQELKGEAFLQLAELYFNNAQYVPSFSYYDSTLIVLKEQDPRLKSINQRYGALKELAQHYTVINTEDSVRRIAAMSPVVRDSFITNLIEQQQLALAQSAQDKQQQDGSMADDPFFYRNFSNQLTRQTDNQGQWYFYNPTTISLGKMDFEKRWGKRNAEDNWRRSDKGTSAPMPEMATPGQPSDDFESVASAGEPSIQDQQKNVESSTPTKETLIAGIPLTAEKMAQSDDRLAQALFNAGMVFFDQFEDHHKAVILFKKMLSDFPDHPLAEQSWFWAFRCYSMLGNSAGMEEMKHGLLNRYPDSRFTAFVTDPHFQEKQAQKEKDLNDAYENAYSAYLRNNYQQVLTYTQTVLSTGEKEELLRKSHLLRAVTQGKTGNNQEFEGELRSLVTKYENSPEGTLAAKWLAMLEEGRQPITGPRSSDLSTDTAITIESEDTPAEILSFQFQPDLEQYLILIVNQEADINRLFFNLADYNFSRFLLADYEIETKSLPDGQKVLTIGHFRNYREVMDYFYALRENSGLFNVDNIGTTSIFTGSAANLTQLISSGDIIGFRDFFSEKYLSGSSGTKINPEITHPQPIPEEKITPSFTTSDGLHWGIVLLTGKFDRNRVSTFLTNHALNNLRMLVSVKIETLSSGEELLLIEAFEKPEGVTGFFTSLENNYFWNNQLGANKWTKIAISPTNFEIIKNEGSVVNYLEFYKENYLKK